MDTHKIFIGLQPDSVKSEGVEAMDVMVIHQ